MGRVNKRMRAALRRREREGRGEPLNILATRRPPPEVSSEEQIPYPYLTSDDMAEWFEGLAGMVPTDGANSIEENLELGWNFLSGLEEEVTKGADQETKECTVQILNQQQERLFKGIYPTSKGNALFPIQAFLAHHQIGLYPPEWVLEWLYAAFEKYAKSQGQDDIGVLLGTKRKRGQTPIAKELQRILTESALLNEIGYLTLLGASIPDAAYMVQGRMEAVGLPCQSSDTLASVYSKREYSKLFSPMKALFSKLPLEDRKRMLAMYPAHTIPEKLK